jgi:hypothetical protein
MINAPRTPAERVERFRAWLEAFTGALETGDLDALGRLFAVECSYRAGPFTPALRGRSAIRAHFDVRLPGMPGLSSRAEVLGVGATYGMARWQLSWDAEPRVPAEADGILLVALDPTGRCSAVREWSIEGRTGT